MPTPLPYKVKTIFTGIPSSSAVEEYIEKKLVSLGKLLSHHAEKTNEALFEVEVGKTTGHHQKGNVYRAEMNFIAGGTLFRAEAVRDDLYAAIDEAKDEIQKIFERDKDRSLALLKKTGRKIKKMQNG